MSGPTTVTDLVTQTQIEQLALPSNLAYGTEIFNRGAVELIQQKANIIEGWAGGLSGTVREGGGSRRRVTFTVENKSLRWNCTGNPKNHQIFCKHCVAIALTIKGSKAER
ncbi:MAG TPA: hypothetical protein VLE69_01560 [Candidatus Saccharimonadales bacterium]|nr:hypothetical protein [Candidatus Saccharimonadales bacterium]